MDEVPDTPFMLNGVPVEEVEIDNLGDLEKGMTFSAKVPPRYEDVFEDDLMDMELGDVHSRGGGIYFVSIQGLDVRFWQVGDHLYATDRDNNRYTEMETMMKVLTTHLLGTEYDSYTDSVGEVDVWSLFS